jgi:hypothetical protein
MWARGLMLQSSVFDTEGFQLIHVSMQNHFDKFFLWKIKKSPQLPRTIAYIMNKGLFKNRIRFSVAVN